MHPELRCGIQTCPGTLCFLCVRTQEFARTPNLRKPRVPIETKKTRNPVWSRVPQRSVRDDFSGPVSYQKRALRQNTSKAPEHQSVVKLIPSTRRARRQMMLGARTPPKLLGDPCKNATNAKSKESKSRRRPSALGWAAWAFLHGPDNNLGGF